MSLRRIGRENVSLSVFGGRCSGSRVTRGKKADLEEGFREEGVANCSAICRALLTQSQQQLPPGCCLIQRDFLYPSAWFHQCRAASVLVCPLGVHAVASGFNSGFDPAPVCLVVSTQLPWCSHTLNFVCLFCSMLQCLCGLSGSPV